MEVKEWHHSSVYHCECKQKSKGGGSLGNEAIICELFVIFQVDFWSLEWLCLSVSLARDCSFMETLRWPLDGEWVEGEEGKGGGGGVIGCERERIVHNVFCIHTCTCTYAWW